MADGVDDLTEKEKEALRLLLAGHDAKSTAIALDISVHTVNDRLRAARRKLSVSSSREAARILGAAEAESTQTLPQNLVREGIGVGDSASSSDNADLTNTKADPPRRWIWLTGGMLIMSITIAAAVILGLMGSGPGATPQEPATEAAAQVERPDSILRAEAFLAAVDASEWEGSWELAGPVFQSQASAEEWTAMVEPVRSPLGDVVSRELVTVQNTSTLPGAPAGEYEILQFRTDFEGAPRLSIETVVMLKSEDGWEVNGYFIA